MSGKSAKMMRRQIKKAVDGKMRENWAALASLRFRDRLRLAWWMFVGQKELPQKG